MLSTDWGEQTLEGRRENLSQANKLSASTGGARRAPLRAGPAYFRDLFLAYQAARHIDPAVGTDHAGNPDAILVLACRGAAKLERRAFAEGCRGCLRLAGPLREAKNLSVAFSWKRATNAAYARCKSTSTADRR
jgi:hypothetical protein